MVPSTPLSGDCRIHLLKVRFCEEFELFVSHLLVGGYVDFRLAFRSVLDVFAWRNPGRLVEGLNFLDACRVT